MHLWMREILWIFWMKMHAWMHELFLPFWYCSLFLIECIYECIKLDFFCFIIFEECIYECMWIFWMKIHAWMHEFFLLFDFVLFFLKNAFMNARNFVNFLNENTCLNAWILFTFWFCSFFLKNAFMNAWNFVNFLNENTCLNAWNFDYIFVLLFLKNAYMNAWNLIFEECMLKCMKFCVFIIIEWKCMFKCMKFYF